MRKRSRGRLSGRRRKCWNRRCFSGEGKASPANRHSARRGHSRLHSQVETCWQSHQGQISQPHAKEQVDIGRDVKSKKARYKEFPREKNWQIDTASVSATKPPRQSGVTISARKEKARRTSSTTKRVLTHSDASETKRRKKMKQKRSRA